MKALQTGGIESDTWKMCLAHRKSVALWELLDLSFTHAANLKFVYLGLCCVNFDCFLMCVIYVSFEILQIFIFHKNQKR